MKPYKLIQGSIENIEAFEEAVSMALEEGYELANRLITKVIATTGGSTIVFFQPMVFEEELDVIYEEGDLEDEDDELV